MLKAEKNFQPLTKGDLNNPKSGTLRVKGERISHLEKLKSPGRIAKIFDKGKSVKAYPIRFLWIERAPDSNPYLIVWTVAVPKRNFKKAVDRNYLKRIVREGFRRYSDEMESFLEKNQLKLDLIILYQGKDRIPFEEIKSKLILNFERLIEKLKEKADN